MAIYSAKSTVSSGSFVLLLTAKALSGPPVKSYMVDFPDPVTGKGAAFTLPATLDDSL